MQFDVVFCALDFPFTSSGIPLRVNDFRTKPHVFSECETIANFVQILPDVFRLRKEARPFWIESKWVSGNLSMTFDAVDRETYVYAWEGISQAH